MYESFACTYICVLHAGQHLQRVSDLSELELQVITRYCVGFGNQGQVFWMNSMCSLLLSPLTISKKYFSTKDRLYL